ncbi:MAG: ANTAR domain-containing protein [Clostridiales bacterium]|nr:ANTAR domain-containing protein [Candidatus Apopatocola equi]
MQPEEYGYRALLVSSSSKFNDTLRPLLTASGCTAVTVAGSVAAARRSTLESRYDFVIVNAPLPDDPGFRFASEQAAGRETVSLVFVRSELFEETKSRLTPAGVFTLPKPTSSAAVSNGLGFMAAAREKLRGLEKKTLTLEEKMEEIRLVNRAKWLLIDRLKMTEPDAHRYIEKQAMDTCRPKGEIAGEILRTYG